MGYTPQQERSLALSMIGEDKIRAAVATAVDEEFGHAYGGEAVADRVVQMLRSS